MSMRYYLLGVLLGLFGLFVSFVSRVYLGTHTFRDNLYKPLVFSWKCGKVIFLAGFILTITLLLLKGG